MSDQEIFQKCRNSLYANKYKLIFEYITGFISENGYAPSERTIAADIDMPKASVGRFLIFMEEDGILDRNSNGTYVPAGFHSPAGSGAAIPLYGPVSCGMPQIEDSFVWDRIVFPDALLSGSEDSYFSLYANGDSMKGAGIDDGDLLIIRRQDYARDGQIVVALVNGCETYLKRFYQEGSMITLKPENENYPALIYDTRETPVIIQGVLEHMIKTFI